MHLCFFEIPNTILNLVNHDEILLDNGATPSVSVGAIAKKDLSAGFCH